MALYLSSQELIARVHLGKEVEQWLSCYNEADYTVIRWISIAEEDGQFGVTYFESFDEGDEEFHDVHEFSVIDPEDEPHGTTHLFNSVEATVAFAVENYGASANRFVASGMIYQEYVKYLLKNMEADFTILKISWFTAVQGRVGSDESYHALFRAVVEFLQGNNLTTRTILEKGSSLTNDACFMRSDLTDKGFELYRRVEQRWLKAIDKGKDPVDMTVFKKELLKL